MSSEYVESIIPVRYLQFKLGEENYAMELLKVKEVIPVPDTTPLPSSPPYYTGIMNLRGQIISIIDLRKKLSIVSNAQNAEVAVIIVEIDGIGIGVMVDYIGKVLNLKNSDIAEVPEVSKQINAKYIQGVYKDGDVLNIFLDIASILNINEIKNTQKKIA